MSGDGKSKMLMKGDFAPCKFFDQWDQCLDSNGDGVRVKFLVEVHTVLSWSPTMSVFGDCGLTQVPQMPKIWGILSRYGFSRARSSNQADT